MQVRHSSRHPTSGLAMVIRIRQPPSPNPPRSGAETRGVCGAHARPVQDPRIEQASPRAVTGRSRPRQGDVTGDEPALLPAWKPPITALFAQPPRSGNDLMTAAQRTTSANARYAVRLLSCCGRPDRFRLSPSPTRRIACGPRWRGHHWAADPLVGGPDRPVGHELETSVPG